MVDVEIIEAETALIEKAQEVDKETQLALCSSFEPYFKQANEWKEQAESIVVTSADDKQTVKEARALRLKLKQLRVDTEKTRKKLKEDSVRRGKAIDGMANIIKFLIEPCETHLQEQEDFAKREREKEIARLQGERSALMDEYEFDHSSMKLGEMAEDAFNGLLQMAKDAHEKRKRDEEERAEAERKRLEAEAKAEAERKAKEAAERKLIEEENARLKAEQEAKEAELQKEREEREKERKALEAKQAAERKKVEAAEKKRKAEAAKKLKAEQEAKAAAEAEAKRLREAEEKRQREEAERLAAEEAERQAALQADDDVKLKALVAHIQSIDLKSEDSRELLENIVLDIYRFLEA